MIGASIRVERNEFPKVQRDLPNGVDVGLGRVAERVVYYARPYVRVKTGALRGDTSVAKVRQGHWRAMWNRPYAIFQNFGTVYMSGTHFAERGRDEAAREAPDIVLSAVIPVLR